MAEDLESTPFEIAFNTQSHKAHDTALRHGWYDNLKGGEGRNAGEALALIHCELSEALQALRDGNKPDGHCPKFSSLEVELADAIIRIMDYAAYADLNIGGAIEAKMKYNESRPYKHGKLF